MTRDAKMTDDAKSFSNFKRDQEKLTSDFPRSTHAVGAANGRRRPARPAALAPLLIVYSFCDRSLGLSLAPFWHWYYGWVTKISSHIYVLREEAELKNNLMKLE